MSALLLGNTKGKDRELRKGRRTLLLSDGGIARVGERARLPTAEPGDVVLVLAEVLGGRPEVRREQSRRGEVGG